MYHMIICYGSLPTSWVVAIYLHGFNAHLFTYGHPLGCQGDHEFMSVCILAGESPLGFYYLVPIINLSLE